MPNRTAISCNNRLKMYLPNEQNALPDRDVMHTYITIFCAFQKGVPLRCTG